MLRMLTEHRDVVARSRFWILHEKIEVFSV